MSVKGSRLATFQHKGQILKTQLLIVEQKVQPVLGLTACKMLNLVKRVFVVTSQTSNDKDPLVMEYKDVFEGLGCLPGEHKIHIDGTVTPLVPAC